jgi:tungstate transport system substrate-binding protein
MDRRRRPVLVFAAMAAVLAPRFASAQRRSLPDGTTVPGWGSTNSDLVLIGPANDPAGVSGMRDAAEALRRIASMGATFISGGGGSGTREMEFRLWRAAGVDPMGGRGRWYREVREGTGAALEAAAASNAYVLADRSAWLALRDRRKLRIVVEGDRRLSN